MHVEHGDVEHGDVERGSGERAITLRPEGIALAAWREIYAGAAVRLDAACGGRVGAGGRGAGGGAVAGERGGRGRVGRPLAEGAPVYGVNTGFGKLAGISITADDLAG